MQRASATAHTAVEGAGVHTTALPHASAGATSSAGIVYGQFHGLITPTTPRGRRTRNTRLPGENEFGSSPPSRFASSAAMCQYSTSSSTSSYASARSGLPWSTVSVRASSSRRDSITSATATIFAARSNAVRRAHASAAARAASIACRASSRSPCGTVPITSPVAGLVASNVSPVALARQSPPTNISCSVVVAIARPSSPGSRGSSGPDRVDFGQTTDI